MRAKGNEHKPPVAVARKPRRGRPGTGETIYDDEEAELLKAMEEWKRKNKRKFPSYSEVLAVLKELGWKKVG